LKPANGQINTIDRPRSPIVMKGDKISSFLGQPVTAIRLVRFRASAGQWEPVPFQIDEMDGPVSFDGPKNGTLDAGTKSSS